MSVNEINHWHELSLTHLFFAFRKAKVDCFYESSIRVSERFVKYELNLAANLIDLLSRLNNGGAREILLSGMGVPIVFPKRLHISQADDQAALGHAFFSDPERAFKRVCAQNMVPEFRLIGDFTVECHILSALWVNLIGHKFDARLSPRALASRVRRYKPTKDRDRLGKYHLEALGSFEPYFTPYRKWRDDGIKTMKDNVSRGDSIVALTLDVGNFYHRIDPSFFVNPRFQEYLGLSLTEFERGFSDIFSEALSAWSQLCLKIMKEFGCSTHDGEFGGIPIGLSIVRIISNAVLAFLDDRIEKDLSPIYYARYVDDLFLVMKDDTSIESQEQLWELISKRIPAFTRTAAGNVTLSLPEWAGSTKLELQAAKQKTFFLSGRTGMDLLENIASQIREVSSERRLMPLAEHLNTSQSAKALAATETADDADSLRRADGLTLKRLGWSVLLRSVSTLARDLDPKDWAKERNEFYEFAHEHVIRPDKILEQIDHLPRLFSLAISLADWKQALRMYRATVSAVFELEKVTSGRRMKINGAEAPSTMHAVWEQTRSQVKIFFREAFVRAYPTQSADPRAKAFASILKEMSIEQDSLREIALMSRETDWARIPYREHLRVFAQRRVPVRPAEETLYNRYRQEAVLRQFLDRSELPLSGQLKQRVSKAVRDSGDVLESLLPYLLPTRPYTPEEIALYLPRECVLAEPLTAARSWADYTRALRGVWVRSELIDEAPANNIVARLPDVGKHVGPPDPPIVVVQKSEPKRPVKLGITSFSTSDATWARAAAGAPDRSPERYRALAKIVNAAVTEAQKPDYLILPELSVPEQWVATISGRLLDSGISFIAGLDYARHPNNQIDSSAVLVLRDDRLGYPSSLQIRQRKEMAAPGEEESLFVSHGQTWKEEEATPKPIYVHNGMFFGVLVCSELQNMDYRSYFQGKVDCVIILSWNKDLETFAALVDSACFDVHAYVALVNNLRYGDSRVRRPAKQSHLRDVCRVRGGLNDQLVVVEIDPSTLRAQQSRARRWPKKEDAYKPAPEGFEIWKPRRTVPS